MKHILIIEDNPSDRMLMKMAIDAQDIQAIVQELDDGEKAMVLLSQLEHGIDSIPDLIMLDLNLPRYSGYQLLSKIRQNPSRRDVPILVISSSDPSKEKARILEYTPHFFRKPHSFDDFMLLGPTIRAILDSVAGSEARAES